MRLTFQQKLMLAFGCMVLPLGLIGVHSAWSLHRENAALRALEANLARRAILAEAENTIYRQIREVFHFLVEGDPEIKAEITRLDEIVRGRIAEWKRTAVDPEEVRITRDLENQYGAFWRVADRIFTLYERGYRVEAVQVTQRELRGRILPDLNRTVAEIYRINRERGLQQAFQEVEVVRRQTQRVLAILVMGSIVAGIFFSVHISRSLARPIEDLKRAMDIVGKGQLDYRVEVRSDDEVGDLARSFVSMIEKLRETQTRLIHSEKLAFIGQMSAAVAHGLRNPLASIRAAAQLGLCRLPPDDPIRENLQAVIVEADRLERRIDHLLDFARPVSFHPVWEQVNRLLENSLAGLAEKIRQQGIRLEVDLQPDLPEVRLDPIRIEQAVSEVISNAVEAMPRGGVLRVTTRRTDEAVEIVVEDTGEGIPQDVLARIFEPFFTTKADGTGLGLAIAKRFVDQNGGTLTIDSQVGRGTSVRIALPVAREA
ncbi:MAG: ATP-binding protein [Acidobacteria bacterium]|nr:ATP-binding protein [Acidobacteriota bacterium]MDW7983690.1 ATP-binding protein [Acidobacteriota bacterium]